MKTQAAEDQRLDPTVVEQAMVWMVRLQSGASSEADHIACQHWRLQSAAHDLAWQRLNGLGEGLRDGTRGLSAQGARNLLQARSAVSRRAVLGGLVGAGVLVASGYGVHQRSLLPTVFSDYATSTGERRSWRLDGAIALQLDTGSAVDNDIGAGAQVLTLNRGRISLEVGQGASASLRTGQTWVRPAQSSRLMVYQEASATLVQLLEGTAWVGYGQGAQVELAAGWQQRFSANGAGSLAALSTGAAAWTRGQLVVERMPLGEVLAELDRYRPGLLRCDPSIAALQVSGAFSIDQPEASLDLLAEVLPVRVQRVFGYWASVTPA